MDTEEQLRGELTEWVVKSVEAHKRLVSLLPSAEHIPDLEEPSSWIFNEELFAEFDKAKKEEETASAKIHEIMDRLSKIRENSKHPSS